MKSLPELNRPIALMDVCLGGVFIGRGESIPEDLVQTWQRRLASLGLSHGSRALVGEERRRSELWN